MKKQEKRPIFSLRVRLVLLVAVELVGSILVALWITRVIQRYFPNDLDILTEIVRGISHDNAKKYFNFAEK